jgi:hypothetical protein
VSLERLLLEMKLPLHYAVFVNWSEDRTRQALLVIDFRGDGPGCDDVDEQVDDPSKSPTNMKRTTS